MKESRGEKIFYLCNYLFLILLALITLYPVIYVLSASFSSSDAIRMGKVVLFPKDVGIDAYKYVFSESQIWISYANSIFYTVVGSAISVALTVCGAYPLSKPDLPGKNILCFIIALSMWLSPPMIVKYLNFRDLNLIDSRWVMLVGFAGSTYHYILMRNFFMGLPRSMEEAAEIDGASQYQILSKIYLPLSIASLATITLFCVVNQWNSYLWPMILINDDAKVPLQVVIKRLIVDLEGQLEKNGVVDTMFQNLSEEGVVYASIVVSAIPMLILYPFIQKHFVKGVMIGAVKG
ncbi:MAG: carbohydrate ABC transporter permease [Ruminococcaceae bacterium]|nr:carbohydrate ABC transporter permease [Oscillospiraceae bacterium]